MDGRCDEWVMRAGSDLACAGGRRGSDLACAGGRRGSDLACAGGGGSDPAWEAAAGATSRGRRWRERPRVWEAVVERPRVWDRRGWDDDGMVGR